MFLPYTLDMTFELPLFPLNTILFPGMPLPLHIFEDRYQQLIRYCLDEGRPFGVVLIREGKAALGPLAEPFSVGCTAVITQAQELEDGRFHIMTVGQERYRIVSLKQDNPYLVGEVESFPLQESPDDNLDEAAEQLYPLVLEYLQILAEAGKAKFDPLQSTRAPQELGYLAASIIQLLPDEKQALLEIDAAETLLIQLQRRYKQELQLLRFMPRQDTGLYSLN